MFHKILQLTKTFSSLIKFYKLNTENTENIFEKHVTAKEKKEKKKTKKRNWHGIHLCLWLKHGTLSIHLLTLYNTKTTHSSVILQLIIRKFLLVMFDKVQGIFFGPAHSEN